MTNHKENEVDTLIEDFLAETPSPSVQDWKRLLEAHPMHADSIAEIALIYAEDRSLNDLNPVQNSDAIYDRTISAVLNMVHKVPSSLLDRAEQRVNAIKGPAARNLAIEIGIGPYPVLLNGILVGRTMAPRKILTALQDKLEVPISALVAFFQKSFDTSAVPAFKATNGNPVLPTKPSTWKDAVLTMQLSTEESQRLLTLDEDEV